MRYMSEYVYCMSIVPDAIYNLPIHAFISKEFGLSESRVLQSLSVFPELILDRLDQLLDSPSAFWR